MPRNRSLSAFSSLREKLAGSLWFIPSVMVSAALVLALVTTLLDDRLETRPFSQFVFTGGPDSARAILQTVAGAVVSFTALVFSITIVALQLSSQQFSPRVLRTFLRDRISQFALGTFIATFIYCLMVLRVVSDSTDAGVAIPSISMMVLLVLVLSSVAMFVAYISHMANSIRVSQIVTAVGNETRALIDRLPEGEGRQENDRRLVGEPISQEIRATEQGILTAIDPAGLVELASNEDVLLVMKRSVGDYIATGQAVVLVTGGEIDPHLFFRQIEVGIERTMQQDVGFGLRQLVDVAERALSPSVNDPTTAVSAINQVHDILRRLAARRFPHHELVDDKDVVRLVLQPLEWDALVDLAFGEIRQYAGSSLQVTRRLLAAIEDIESVALPDRRVALLKEKRLVEELIERSFEAEEDRRTAALSDQQGIGGPGTP